MISARFGTVAVALACLVGGGIPALAATSPAAPEAAVQHVTIELAPRDAAALHALAITRGLARSQRLAQLATLRPSAAEQSAAASALASLGLRVERRSAWSVTASGSAARIRGLFGSARHSGPGQWSHGLPQLPAALRGLATGAFGGDQTGPEARPLNTTYSGAQLAAAYHDTVAGTDSSAIVATIQLSGWHNADLTHYASDKGLPDIVSGGRYAEVSVDGASTTQADGYGGDIEVALDQETLLGVAPHVKQRVYFAPNGAAPGGYSGDGFLDAVHAVALDAAADSHIVALSISWGTCEDPTAQAIYFDPFETALDEARAAGVTIFVATGDTGSLCPDQYGNLVTAAGFPASSPDVVAVGGTTLTNPTGPVESVWNAGTPTNPEAGGGGSSVLFARPAYQAHVCAPTGGRVIPDLSSDAAVSTGFSVYSSSSLWSTGYHTVGGTSLAAPTVAGLFANELVDHGQSTSYVGDLHDKLYSAPATTRNDVTSGNNIGFSAGPGYDLATGLGSVRWDELWATNATADPENVVAVSGTDNRLYQRCASYAQYGGWIASMPSVVHKGGFTYYVAAGSDHNLWGRTDATGWTRMTSGIYCIQPSVFVTGGGAFVAACKGQDNALWYAQANSFTPGHMPALSGWHSLHGILAGGPAIAEINGQLTFFVVGYQAVPAANVYSRTLATNYVRVSNYTCYGTPAVAVASQVHLVCNGRNHAAYHAVYDPAGQTGWPAQMANLGGSVVGVPGVAVSPSETVTVYVVGSDGALYHQTALSLHWFDDGGHVLYGVGAASLTG